MRVLVVEDHVELAETIAAGLRREGMAIDTVQTATTRWSSPTSTTTT